MEYALQACEGLDEAHRAGFVHRDVKPANLFLTRRPNGTACIKIVDFGISKAVTMVRASDALHATSDQAIFGTPLYMAPEQMRAARDVDARADLWSLGASLYELLSGAAPFPAESLVDLAYRIANEAPPSLREKRPEVPEALEQIVLRCLERDRDRRFPDARSLAKSLEPYRAHGAWEPPREPSEDEEMTVIDHPSIQPEPPLVPSSPSAESLGASSVSWGRSQRPARFARWPRPAMLYAAAAVAGVGVFVAVFLSRGDPPQPRVVATVVSAPVATPSPRPGRSPRWPNRRCGSPRCRWCRSPTFRRRRARPRLRLRLRPLRRRPRPCLRRRPRRRLRPPARLRRDRLARRRSTTGSVRSPNRRPLESLRRPRVLRSCERAARVARRPITTMSSGSRSSSPSA